MNASPAKTISPILSFVKWSTRFSTIIFERSKRLGVTSSASIELLISIAIMVSIPVRFSWLIFVPNCGRASVTMSNANAAKSRQNLTKGRKRDTSGINWRTSSGSPKRRKRFFCWCTMKKRNSANKGISTNK